MVEEILGEKMGLEIWVWEGDWWRGDGQSRERGKRDRASIILSVAWKLFSGLVGQFILRPFLDSRRVSRQRRRFMLKDSVNWINKWIKRLYLDSFGPAFAVYI